MRRGELLANLLLLFLPAIIGVGVVCLLSPPVNVIIPAAFFLIGAAFFVRAWRAVVMKHSCDPAGPLSETKSEKRRLFLTTWVLMGAGGLMGILSLLLHLRATIRSWSIPMKLLADESVDRPIVERLRDDGHEVVYVAELSPSIGDDEVLQKANASHY